MGHSRSQHSPSCTRTPVFNTRRPQIGGPVAVLIAPSRSPSQYPGLAPALVITKTEGGRDRHNRKGRFRAIIDSRSMMLTISERIVAIRSASPGGMRALLGNCSAINIRRDSCSFCVERDRGDVSPRAPWRNRRPLNT